MGRLPRLATVRRGGLRLARVVGIAVCVTLGVLWGGRGFFEEVPADSIGVRVTQWGEGGVDSVDYPSGLHASVYGWHDWHYLRRGTHFLCFEAQPGEGEHGVLDVRTKDGTQARVGVVVPYVIRAGEGHRIVADGLKETYGGLVKATVETFLSQQMASLRAQDFTDSGRRSAWVAVNLIGLNEELASLHVEAEAILFSSISFATDYEKKLQQTQLVHQTTLLHEASRVVAIQEELVATRQQEITNELAQIEHDFDVRLDAIRNAGENQVSEVKRETDEYEQRVRLEADERSASLVAEGQRAVLMAEAAKIRFANEAYALPGAELYLGRRAAESLQIQRVTLNSNNPNVPSILDLDELTGLLLGRGK
jgi:hypothetical protein